MVNVYSLLSSISSFCSFAFWGVSIDNYKNKIGEITGKILCGESIEKETVVKLIDLLHVLKSTSCYLEETEELITGTCKTLKVFSNNEKICSMVLKHVFKGTKADGNFSHSHIANREKMTLSHLSLSRNCIQWELCHQNYCWYYDQIH